MMRMAKPASGKFIKQGKVDCIFPVDFGYRSEFACSQFPTTWLLETSPSVDHSVNVFLSDSHLIAETWKVV